MFRLMTGRLFLQQPFTVPFYKCKLGQKALTFLTATPMKLSDDLCAYSRPPGQSADLDRARGNAGHASG